MFRFENQAVQAVFKDCHPVVNLCYYKLLPVRFIKGYVAQFVLIVAIKYLYLITHLKSLQTAAAYL